MKNKALCLAILLGASASAQAEGSKQLSKIESGYCRMMRNTGIQIASGFINLEGNSCLQFVEDTDQIAREYFSQLQDFKATEWTQQCITDGIRNGGLALVEKAEQSCGTELQGAAKAGRSLGYAVCYLSADRKTGSLLKLTPQNQTANGIDFIVHPSFDSEWLARKSQSMRAGFGFGCLSGQKDRVLERPPVGIDAAASGSYALALGRQLGLVFASELCPSEQVHGDDVAQDLPEAERESFLQGLRETIPNTCLN